MFHIDFNGEDFTQKGILQRLIDSYISTWEHEMGIVTDTDIPTGFRFRRVLEAAHNMTGLRAVVLVDEYDKPMLDVMDVDKSLEEEHRNILKGFYSVFKGADELRVQGSRRASSVRIPYGSDQVLAGERVQRLQPAQ